MMKRTMIERVKRERLINTHRYRYVYRSRSDGYDCIQRCLLNMLLTSPVWETVAIFNPETDEWEVE